MEVNSQAKELSKHVLPVIIVLTALMILPIATALGYNFGGDAAARGLVARFINIRPTTNGLSDVTFQVQAPPAGPAAGSYLANDPGQTAQLSIEL